MITIDRVRTRKAKFHIVGLGEADDGTGGAGEAEVVLEHAADDELEEDDRELSRRAQLKKGERRPYPDGHHAGEVPGKVVQTKPVDDRETNHVADMAAKDANPLVVLVKERRPESLLRGIKRWREGA